MEQKEEGLAESVERLSNALIGAFEEGEKAFSKMADRVDLAMIDALKHELDLLRVKFRKIQGKKRRYKSRIERSPFMLIRIHYRYRLRKATIIDEKIMNAIIGLNGYIRDMENNKNN